jgi:hypothetical protein
MEEVHSFLSQIPGLAESVTMEKAMSFVRLASQLKDEIILAQAAAYDLATAPTEIPEHVRSFLGCATDIPEEFVSGCWGAFSDTIWSYDDNGGSTRQDAQKFRDFGLDHLLCTINCFHLLPTHAEWYSHIAAQTLFLPIKQCTTPGCLNSNLLKDKDGLRKVVLFTLSDGACATYAVHLHCSRQFI